MDQHRHIFGPIPSRRLGASLGVSPIPKKTCNYSCIYCQLGRTKPMKAKREMFYPVEEILEEFQEYIENSSPFDVVSIVGEGEPSLYLGLGELIRGLQRLTEKPIAVITNAALLQDEKVREELMAADLVLPSLDAYNEKMYRLVDRPVGSLHFDEVYEGLVTFSKEYSGELWLELMLMHGYNAGKADVDAFSKILEEIAFDRVFINTPVRPPAEDFVEVATKEELAYAREILGGLSIDCLSSGSFFSDLEDSEEAIVNIVGRHPMTQFEIQSFLESREEENIPAIFAALEEDPRIVKIGYKGIHTYRRKI